MPLLETGLTGNKVVRFNGNVLLKSTLPIQLFPDVDSGLTIFTAFSTINNSGQKFVVNWGIKDENNNRGNVELGYDTGMGGGVGNFGLHYGCGLATLTPENTIVNNEFAILSTLVKNSGAPPDNVEIYKNGTPPPLVRNGGANSGCFPDHPAGGWLAPGEYSTGLATLDIGGRDDSGAGSFGDFHTGDIGEILVYQGTLSASDRTAVENYLGERYGVATTPLLVIWKQPATTVVAVGETATFTVEANLAGSTEGLTYQWQKGGVNIAGATGASYTTPPAVAGDNGTKYRVIVRAPDGQTVTSAEANMRIIGPVGQTPPEVASGTLLVRLTADAGVTSDASGVSLWQDQSPNGYEFAPVNANLPLLETGLTGNKVVRFNGNVLLKSSLPMQLFPDVDSGLTIFAAFSTVNNSGQQFVVNWGITDGANRGNLEMGYDTGNGDRRG